MAVELNQNGLPNSIQIDQKLRRSILSAATTNHRSMLPAPGCSHLLTSVLTPPNDNAPQDNGKETKMPMEHHETEPSIQPTLSHFPTSQPSTSSSPSTLPYPIMQHYNITQ